MPDPKPYRPSCGTEGMDFMEEFCFKCEKDRKYRETDNGEDGCQIIVDTFIYEPTDPKYPKEWIYGPDGLPTCTAFEPEKKP